MRSVTLLLCLGLALTVGAASTRSAPPGALSFAPQTSKVAGPSKAAVLVDQGSGRFVRVRKQGSGVALADAIGDLNGDGKPDLVTHYNDDENDTCGESDGVEVCYAYAYVALSRKNGTFRPGHAVYENDLTDVAATAIGDINRDGRRDILIATADSLDGRPGVVVMLGVGRGKFRRAQFVPTANPLAIATSDVNGDGRLDVVTASSNGTVSVLLNSARRLAAPRSYRVGPRPSALAVGDLNGDRRPDLAVARYGPAVHGVSVLINFGRGSFGHRHDYATGNAPQSVAIGDVNGDRRPDLVTANADAGGASVLLNRGGGTFGSRLDYATGSYPDLIAIGKFDHNPSPDLLLAAYDGVTVLVRTPGTCDVQDVWGLTMLAATAKLARAGCSVGTVAHAASTGFAAGRILGQSPDAGAVQSGPVDVTISDGPGPGKIAASPTFGSARSDAIPKGGQVVAIGDLNGDGKPDVVTGSCGASVSVLLNNGHGGLAPAQSYRANCPDTVALADLNGDGRPDVVAGGDDGLISVLLNNGDGTLAKAHVYPLEGGPTYGSSFVAAGDLNGDGAVDLAAVNGFEADQGLSVYFGHGDGTFWPRKDYAMAADAESLALGELNGDGKPDLVFTDLGATGVIFNQVGGAFLQAKGEYVAGGDGSGAFAGDLTGDGLTDAVVTYPDRGTVEVLLDDGSGSLRPYVEYRTATAPAQAAIGDLNGDGTPDLAVAGKSLSILRNRGDGTFLPKRDYTMGPKQPRAVALGDLNGDGRLDLVSANGATVVVRLAR